MQIKPEGKTSSLRSVRVKPERMKDNSILNEKQIEKSDNESLAKLEPLEDSDVKPVISLNNKTIPAKDTEPLTSAVAPVAQKIVPDKSPSPTECKEEGAALNTEAESAIKKEEAGGGVEEDDDDDDVVEVPYKPQVNPEEESKSDTSILQDVKKRKLDILKEGGLEVTPVTGFVPQQPTKDIRPSVIQQITVPKSFVTDAQHMPPPPSNTVPVKRVSSQQNNIPQVPLVPSLQTVTKQLQPTKPFGYVNGQSPPKVVQSRSIYSYSEKTVYGNPKVLPNLNPVHSPRVGIRQSGGDVLDLRVTSPQKPVVEIMRVPAATTLPLNLNDITRNTYRRAQLPPSPPPPPVPLIEGRQIGSNLEITLVGPQSMKSPYSVHNKYSANTPSNSSYSSANKKFSHKRTLSDNYTNNKYSKLEENGKNVRVSGNLMPSQRNGLEITVPNPYMKAQPISSHMKPTNLPSHNSKQFSSTVPRPSPMPANYLPLLQSANKTVPPLMPVVNPFYLHALQQTMYSIPVPPQTPLFPMATPEQLQLYSDLMTQNARSRFPFPYPDTNPSVTTENKKM